jgi:hypothetical protein
MILEGVTIELPIERVRINQCSLWVKMQYPNRIYWQKVDGGPGFKEKFITPQEMKQKVQSLVWKVVYDDEHDKIVRVYHTWYKEGTLNITIKGKDGKCKPHDQPEAS